MEKRNARFKEQSSKNCTIAKKGILSSYTKSYKSAIFFVKKILKCDICSQIKVCIAVKVLLFFQYWLIYCTPLLKLFHKYSPRSKTKYRFIKSTTEIRFMALHLVMYFNLLSFETIALKIL